MFELRVLHGWWLVDQTSDGEVCIPVSEYQVPREDLGVEIRRGWGVRGQGAGGSPSQWTVFDSNEEAQRFVGRCIADAESDGVQSVPVDWQPRRVADR